MRGSIRVAVAVATCVATWSAALPLATAEPTQTFAAPRLGLPSVRPTMAALGWTPTATAASYAVTLTDAAGDGSSRTISTRQTLAVIGGLRPGKKYNVRVTALDASANPLGSPSETLTLRTPKTASDTLLLASTPLSVGSFNVRKAQAGDNRRLAAPWSKRRLVVASQIRSQQVDVVGLQEASWQEVPGRNVSQYMDVVNLLGGGWRAATTKGLGGPSGMRIIYNSERLKLIRQGWRPLAGSTRFGAMRYVSWGVFEMKGSKERFLFANTHLVPGKSTKAKAQRRSEAGQIVRALKATNPEGLPVILVGDMNSNRSDTPADIFNAAGLIDPIAAGTVDNPIRATLSSWNNYLARPKANGIFADRFHLSAAISVLETETVVNLTDSGNFAGTIPSDHNMVRATVLLP